MGCEEPSSFLVAPIDPSRIDCLRALDLVPGAAIVLPVPEANPVWTDSLAQKNSALFGRPFSLRGG